MITTIVLVTIWLLIALLTGLFFFRPYTRKEDKEKSKIKWWYLLVLLSLLTGGVLLYICSTLQIRCPTSISPQELAEMSNQDINYKAQIFQRHDFVEQDDSLFQRDYDYYGVLGKQAYDFNSNERVWRSIKEIILIDKDAPEWIVYHIMNEKKQKQFFRYLLSLGAIQTRIKEKPNALGMKFYHCYRYKSCFFLDGGYDRTLKSNMIVVVNYNLNK